MATIGSIDVAVRARTKQFTKGINRASSAIKKFAGLVAAGFAANAVKNFTTQTMNTIDATAKLADTLGLTTEALIGLQHAGKIAGVTSSEIEVAMRRFEKSVSDANVGLTTAIRAFDTLGISADNLRNRTPEQALEHVLNALGKVENQFARVRVAQDLFGRNGLKILKLTDAGNVSLAQMKQTVAELGTAYSRLDAAKVEAANDAITKMKDALQGAANQLTIAFAPGLESLTKKATEWFKQNQTAVKQWGWVLENWFERAKVGWLTLKLMGISVWEGITGGLKLAASGWLQVFGRVLQGIKKAFGAFAKFTGAWVESFGKHLAGVPGMDKTGRRMLSMGGIMKAKGAGLIATGGQDILGLSEELFHGAADSGDRIRSAYDELIAQAKKVATMKGGRGSPHHIPDAPAAAAGGGPAHAKAMTDPAMKRIQTRQPMQFARQVDLTNMSLAGGFRKKQEQAIKSKQLEKTNELLAKLVEQNMSKVAVMG